MTALDIEIIFF